MDGKYRVLRILKSSKASHNKIYGCEKKPEKFKLRIKLFLKTSGRD